MWCCYHFYADDSQLYLSFQPKIRITRLKLKRTGMSKDAKVWLGMSKDTKVWLRMSKEAKLLLGMSK